MLAILIGGVTISNLAMVALIMLAAALVLGQAPLLALVRTAAVIISSALFCLVVEFGLCNICAKADHPIDFPTYLSMFIDPTAFLSKLVTFPRLFVFSVLATSPLARANSIALAYGFDLDLRFSFDYRALDPMLAVSYGALAALLWLVWWVWRDADPGRRYAALAGTALLAYNIALHALFGNEVFLYALHWLAPLVLLTALPLLKLDDRGRARLVTGLLAAGLIVVTVNNAITLDGMAGRIVEAL